MKILVVTAHPDDLENGMGGTISLLAKAGHDIYSIIATVSSGGDRETRIEESRASHQLLGINPPQFLGNPDGKLEDTLANRAYIKLIIEGIAPDVVFTLWPADVHPDHRAIAALTLNACMLFGTNTEVLAFEVCSSGRRAKTIRPQSLGFYPTHYVNIAGTALEAKKRSMYCHKTQDPDGMWFGIENMLNQRGMEAGSDHAEAFVRLTRYGELNPEFSFFLKTLFFLPRGIGPMFDKEWIGL